MALRASFTRSVTATELTRLASVSIATVMFWLLSVVPVDSALPASGWMRTLAVAV